VSPGNVTLSETFHVSDVIASLITFSQSQRYCRSFLFTTSFRFFVYLLDELVSRCLRQVVHELSFDKIIYEYE
jgi:hypothetical protein